MLELAYNTIILYLGDTVMGDVSKEKNAAEVWLKLEQLYMTKSMTNTVYLKGRLFGLKMIEEKSLDDWLDEFDKVV